MKKKLTKIIGVYSAKENPKNNPERINEYLNCFLKNMNDRKKKKLAGRIGVV
tara:strand:+ start:158 stop:313 length:156 start_codon:yes stop_codon:yes gene_type:complete